MSEDVRKSDVLIPSAASVGLCIAIVLLSLLFVVLPRLGSDTLLSLVFGEEASLSLINSSKDSYGPMIEGLLQNDLLGRAVVFGVWAFVGLCTFVLITFVSGVINTINEQKREMEYVHQNKAALIRSDLITLAYRLGVAAAWALWLIVCIRFVFSYFAVTGFVAFGGGGVVDWLVFIVASFIFFVSLHVQVIFARLLVGRTRIWQD